MFIFTVLVKFYLLLFNVIYSRNRAKTYIPELKCTGEEGAGILVLRLLKKTVLIDPVDIVSTVRFVPMFDYATPVS